MNLKLQYKLIILFIVLLSFFGFVVNEIQKKIIRTNEFDIEFFVSTKKNKKAQQNKMYHWYKTGKIHTSMSGIGGALLHDNYSKFYIGAQLAEQGKFHYGLKIGKWKKWHINGNLEEESNWLKGTMYGSYKKYDEDGILVVSGFYTNGIKTKKWIDHKVKDTVWYKKGTPTKEKPNLFKKKDKKNKKDKLKSKKASAKKTPFFKRLFKNNKKKKQQ